MKARRERPSRHLVRHSCCDGGSFSDNGSPSEPVGPANCSWASFYWPAEPCHAL